MSLFNISRFGMVALSAFSLLFIVSCSKEETKKDQKTETPTQTSTEKNSIFAETVADYVWEGEFGEDDEKLWSFEIKFIPEEAEGKRSDGTPFKNLPITSHYGVLLKNVKQAKGYKPGIEPLKHQKIKIRYEKEEPAMFSRLESFKCKDTEGNIIEMDF